MRSSGIHGRHVPALSVPTVLYSSRVCAGPEATLTPLIPLLSENMMDMHVQMHELILCLVYLLTQHDGRTHEAASNSYPAPV